MSMNRYVVNESSTKERPRLFKEYVNVIDEYMDIVDNKTREDVLYVNEEGQSKVLTALTGKLYDAIVDKVDDIDYGDIPNTKGDITKLPNFDKIRNCIDLLLKIVEEYKQDPAPVLTVFNALNNVIVRKDLFEKAFKYGLELPVVIYSNVCLAIISSTSYLISTCIDFIKSPSQDDFTISLDRVALAKTKQHLLFTNLERFNKACRNGELDKAINHIIDNKTKKLSGVAVIGIGAAIIGIGAIALSIIPLMRELVFFFYYTKARVSDYFDIQADLLQMNAYNLENAQINKDPKEKEEIIKKQMAIVARYRKIANKLAINGKESENKSEKEIATSNKKYKSSELNDEDSPISLF